MGAAAARRCVEWLLGLYFVSHIPVTLFIDLQVVLPPELYPQEVRARGSPTWPSRFPWARCLTWAQAGSDKPKTSALFLSAQW